MKKYWMVFKISWSRLGEYRFNLFLNQLRVFVVLLMLYYVWRSLIDQHRFFAGYGEKEIMTYVFGALLLRSFVFGEQSREAAQEINTGLFSQYLLRPISYISFIFMRELPARLWFFLLTLVQIVLLILILKPAFFVQSDLKINFMFIFSVFLAMALYFLMSFLVNLLAFWSRETGGPRFLWEWILEFASGAYFPLNVLYQAAYWFLAFTPWAFLIYFPLRIYLGKISHRMMWEILGGEMVWLLLVAGVVYGVWKKGLKIYSGEGA